MNYEVSELDREQWEAFHTPEARASFMEMFVMMHSEQERMLDYLTDDLRNDRINFSELDAWVNDPLDDDIGCMDIEDPSRVRPSDDQGWQMIREIANVTNASAFQQLADDIKKQTLLELKERQASLRQLERLTGIGKGVIHRIWGARH